MPRDRDGMDSNWVPTPSTPTPYKYEQGDLIYVQSCTGLENTRCTVHSRYTSDSMNHEAAPHKRYVVTMHHPRGDTIVDFAEIEFSKERLDLDA